MGTMTKIYKEFFNSSLQLFSALSFFVILIYFVSGCSTVGHYEKGKEYLSNKQYTEAISEFQKVEAGDKEFKLAQSKINYIQGLQAFNDSLFQSAEVLLLKVDTSDEFYHDSQLMLEKMRMSKTTNTETRKDTLIIKHEETSNKGREKIEGKEKITGKTDAEITKKYVEQQENLIYKFESLYQSAHTASVESKKDYMNNMQSVLSQINSLSYNAKEKDAGALELKQKAASWMNKRISFINRLVVDNTVSETASSRSIKEEGDKMYYAVTSQLKKVK